MKPKQEKRILRLIGLIMILFIVSVLREIQLAAIAAGQNGKVLVTVAAALGANATAIVVIIRGWRRRRVS